MNGVNLNHFQFEYDLTWMAFFQNSEGRTYVRYGGREDENPDSHLSKTSLLATMRQALQLHERGDTQPVNRYEPQPATASTPEDIPPMRAMIGGRKESCIHCHDVKVATLRHSRTEGTLRKNMIFTYPSPRKLGILLNADRQSTIDRVTPASPADAAGLKPGDIVRAVEGQRVLTFADFTRVLELAPREGRLAIDLTRRGEAVSSTIELPAGWRANDDASWRASSGVVGPNAGLWGVRANAVQRRQLGLGDDDLAVKVTYIHKPWSRNAGIKLNDYIVAIDGVQKDMTIRQLQAHLHLNKNWGDTIELVINRNGRRQTLKMTFPDKPPN